MGPSLIQDWLAKYKVLPQKELKQYGRDILLNRDMASALYNLFENDLSNGVVAPVCHQLFDFFCSKTPELRYFSIGMIPMLLSTYLIVIGHSDKKRTAAVEACLLGMYNLEVGNSKGQAKKDDFTIPTLAASSIYHEPPSLAALALTESALLRYHGDVPTIISIGSQPQVESITAQNRFTVLTYLLQCFNGDIVHVPTHAHRMLCRMCSKIVRMGFAGESNELAPSRTQSSASAPDTARDFSESGRIAVTSGFLIELTRGIYYAMYNGQTQRGILAMNDVHRRACFELYPDVILLTNAIKNGLKQSPPGGQKNNLMGISISSSPRQVGTVSKCAITNASFRAKKLPDDIASDLNHDEQTGTEEQYDEDIEVPHVTTSSDKPPCYEDVALQDGRPTTTKANGKKTDRKLRRADSTSESTKPHESHQLSILSEESGGHTDLSLISLHMSDGDSPPRRRAKEITLDVLTARRYKDVTHKHTCGSPDKSCCCGPSALAAKTSDTYVALVDGKTDNGPQRRVFDGPCAGSKNPDSLNTQL